MHEDIKFIKEGKDQEGYLLQEEEVLLIQGILSNYKRFSIIAIRIVKKLTKKEKVTTPKNNNTIRIVKRERLLRTPTIEV